MYSCTGTCSCTPARLAGAYKGVQLYAISAYRMAAPLAVGPVRRLCPRRPRGPLCAVLWYW